MTFVVDDDVRLIAWNSAANAVLGADGEHALLKRAGDVLHCLNAGAIAGGCGQLPICADCVIRNSVRQATGGESIFRKSMQMTLEHAERKIDLNLVVTAVPFAYHDRSLVLLILDDVSELVRLRHLLPICARCKKIRDDANYWKSVEQYFIEHLDVKFSHGLCPDCVRSFYDGEGEERA